MKLKTPLEYDQIKAAKEIHVELRAWREADSALRALAAAFPGFNADATLLKVAAVNTLYGTNLYAFHRMARHITKVMARNPKPALDLAERFACLPPVPGQKTRRHWSFASKFCHFFLDPQTFPIYDTWARQTLQRHLAGGREVDPKRPYTAFVNNLHRLIEQAGLTVAPADLDSYLWIRGGFEVWRRKPDAKMNGELKAFFQENERSRLMKRLLRES